MTDWTLTLEGGPRHGDRIASPALLPFLKFTEGAQDGTTRDHYYAPTSSDPVALVAVYGWLSDGNGPDEAVARIWEQGYEAGFRDGDSYSATLDDKDNPYRKAKA